MYQVPDTVQIAIMTLSQCATAMRVPLLKICPHLLGLWPQSVIVEFDGGERELMYVQMHVCLHDVPCELAAVAAAGFRSVILLQSILFSGILFISFLLFL